MFSCKNSSSNDALDESLVEVCIGESFLVIKYVKELFEMIIANFGLKLIPSVSVIVGLVFADGICTSDGIPI